MDDQNREEGLVPEGADDLPGGSAPGGAQPAPAEQEGFGEATVGEAEAEEVEAGETPEERDPPRDSDDPMIDEPSEGEKGGARAERDQLRGVPDTPATEAEGGAS